MKSKTPEYRAWQDMLQRCNNPRNPAYRHYGGRGITVCARWQCFANFLEDLGPRPPAHSLDRIDVNGSYAPANCRWATAAEQARNTRAQLGSSAGVSYSSRDHAWRAFITVGHKVIALGSFQSAEQASFARRAAEQKYWVEGEAPLTRDVQRNNRSGYTGVAYLKREQKWLAYRYVQRKRHDIGLFSTAEAAAAARAAHGIGVSPTGEEVKNHE